MQFERGGSFPHVVVRSIDGTTFSYGDIWQRRNLLLIALASEAGAPAGDESAYITELLARGETFQEYNTEVVITRDAVAGLRSPALLIADRWGEIVMVDRVDATAGLPKVEEIVEWLRFVAHACPECEGEAR